MSGENRKLASDKERLFQAVSEGRVKKSRIILEASDGLLDRARNEDGHTLLIAACYSKAPARLHMVNMLLDRDPEVNRRDLKGRTALSHASELGHVDIIARLIQHRSVDPDAFDFKGNTPLMHASMNDQPEVIILLSQNFRRLGLKVDQINDDGFTALHLAAMRGHVESCKALVNHSRAARGIRDKYNNMLPIEWLRKSGSSDISIAFLRPRERFFRIAKIATSLAKAKGFSDKGILSPGPDQQRVRAVFSDKKVKLSFKLQKQKSEEGRSKRRGHLSPDSSKLCPCPHKVDGEKERKRRNSSTKVLETKCKPKTRPRKNGVQSCQKPSGGSQHGGPICEELLKHKQGTQRDVKRKAVDQSEGTMSTCTVFKADSNDSCAESVATSLESINLEENNGTEK